MSSTSSPTEFIFLGTGTSASLPYLDCLTSPRKEEACKTCLSTLSPDGKYNIRRNTSAVVKMQAQNGREVTIVIDAGKTFQAASIEWFPRYGLRKIDAVLITHGHADAMYGLDDFRAWTLYGLIQPCIDVYLSQETFEAVQRSFPYLISEKYASGGGDVPEFKWHIISDQVPFEINDTGIQILPFAVHHGHIRTSVASPSLLQVPFGSQLTRPSTPVPNPTPKPHSHARRLSDRFLAPSPFSPTGFERPTEDSLQPYLSFGFKIREDVIYISDASHIPDNVWPLLAPPKGSPAIPVCVLDCLQLKPHVSHLHLAQSVAVARRIGARKTYLTGFCHEMTHDQYVNVTSALGVNGRQDRHLTLSKVEGEALATIAAGDPLWIRPAHDGLRVFIHSNGTAQDETYSDVTPHVVDEGSFAAFIDTNRWFAAALLPKTAFWPHIALIITAICCGFACGYLSGSRFPLL